MTDGLAQLHSRLDDAALDPKRWPDACDALADLFGATGTLILPEDADARSLAMPHSSSLGEALQSYISRGWYRHDFRAQGFPHALANGFVTDHDLISVEEMRRHPYYNELLAPFDLRWFIGTTLNVGGKVWGVAVQASPARGPFGKADAELLLRAKHAVELAGNRTAALGFKRIEIVEDVLRAGGKGVALLSKSGRILVANELAETLLAGAGLIRADFLKSGDRAADHKLDLLRRRLLAPDLASAAFGPVLLPEHEGQVLSLDLLPMPRDFGAVFSGAFAFLTVQALVATDWSDLARLMHDWRLTRREAELAAHLLAGRQLAEASREMKLSIGTARQYLKSVFRKTGTARQADLVLRLRREGNGH